jgi:hypothetical protein
MLSRLLFTFVLSYAGLACEPKPGPAGTTPQPVGATQEPSSAAPATAPTPPDCKSIRSMDVCKQTAGCMVSSMWVVGFPDADPPPQHHQYECVIHAYPVDTQRGRA